MDWFNKEIGWIVTLATIMSICGCAVNPDAFREDKPRAEFLTEKPPKETTICLAETWDRVQQGGIGTYRETPLGYMFTVSCGGELCLVADVVMVSQRETKVSIYSKNFGTRPFYAEARRCRN